MMQTPFDAFLSAVLSHVRYRPAREKISAELRGHLEDRAEALISQGMEREEAQARAVAAMGDPAKLGDALDLAHPCVWSYLYWVLRPVTVAVCLAVFVPLVVFSAITAHSMLVPFTISDRAPAVIWSSDLDLTLTMGNHRVKLETVYQQEDGSISIQYTDLIFPNYAFSSSAGVGAISERSGLWTGGSGMSRVSNTGLFQFSRSLYTFDTPVIENGAFTILISAAGQEVERTIPLGEVES